MSWQQQPYNPNYGGQWSGGQQRPPPGGSAPPYNPASAPPPGYGGSQWQPPTQSVGGYNPQPPTQSVGGYNPQPPTQSVGGYNPQPPTQSVGGYNPAGGAGYQAPPTSSYTPGYQPPPTSSYNPGYQPPPSGQGSYGGQYASGGYGAQGQPQDPELMSWFAAVDKDGSGKISALELREALVNNNWSHFNSETCRLLVGMFDKNGDGTIEFNEFAALWKYVQEWKSCFTSFDKDGSGNIDAGELQQALTSFGYRLSMDFCRMCTLVFDRSDKRSMKFDDFIQCCVMLKSLTESFKKLDSDRNGVININYEQFLEMAIDNSCR